MRTTLIIPDSIYQRAKKLAQEQNKTLSELSSEALEIQILRWEKASKEKRRPYKLRPFPWEENGWTSAIGTLYTARWKSDG